MGRRPGWMLLMAGLCGCEERQETHLVLADYTAEARFPGATIVAGSDRTDGSEFRELGVSVPLSYEWNVARDADGCLQPARLRVQRTGGDPRLVIDSIVVENGPCWQSRVDSLPWSSARVVVHYRGRRGNRTSSGNILLGRLEGTGRFVPSSFSDPFSQRNGPT